MRHQLTLVIIQGKRFIYRLKIKMIAIYIHHGTSAI
jgi:hypothetical protein